MSDDASQVATEFRKAARGIARAPNLTHTQKLAALMRLGERARASDVPELAGGAVWAEASHFLYGEPPPALGPDPVERACRGLLREGYERCPSCKRPLPDDREFDRWESHRKAILEAHQAFEEAVP